MRAESRRCRGVFRVPPASIAENARLEHPIEGHDSCDACGVSLKEAVMGTTHTRTGLVALVPVCLVAVVSCAAPAPVEQKPAAQPVTEAVAPPLRSPVSINAEMVTIVDHAGHQLWDVERPGNAPKTDAAWANLEEHATQIAAAGALVSLAGTGTHDIVWTGSPGWQKWSRAMSDAGLAALKASQDKNLDALVAANGQLVESCEGCHKEFKPELPSEGITHAHAHPFRTEATR
jgi:cytochrome c556